MRLIELFAGKAASNIELQRAYGELEQQSRTDGLTGLYNHRFFQERLAAEVARAQRFEKPLTLLMIDVDDFKEFNDAFGHPEGDRLLKSARRPPARANARPGRLRGALRRRGVRRAAARDRRRRRRRPAAGAAAGPGRGPAARGLAVAEAIRAATQAQTFDTASGAAGGVTVSVGVATFPDHASTGDQLSPTQTRLSTWPNASARTARASTGARPAGRQGRPLWQRQALVAAPAFRVC